MQRVKQAFTLIELLIVITIIGILAVYLVPRIVGVPAKGRDAARVQALNQISTALESYKSEHGKYPTPTGSATGVCATDANLVATSKALGGKVPTDPQPGRKVAPCATDGAFLYKTFASGQEYVLIADTEADGASEGYYKLSELMKAANDSVAKILACTACKVTYTEATDVYSATGSDNVYAITRK